MLRAIREIQPRWVVGENVRGLTNWNGGLVFDEVQADLGNEGYEVTPYLLPACAVNAPHRRDRIWFIAFNTKQVANGRHNGGTGNGERFGVERNGMVSPGREQGTNDFGASDRDATHPRQTEQPRRNEPTQGQQYDGGWDARSEFAPFGGSFDAANTGQARRCNWVYGEQQRGKTSERGDIYQKPNWKQFPTQSPLCSRNDGVPAGLVGITFSKHREKSIGAYGNAIVPQVAFQIFKAIQQYEQNLHNHPRGGNTIKAT